MLNKLFFCTFLFVSFVVTPVFFTHAASLDSIISVWHGGIVIEEGDVITRDDVLLLSNFWTFKFYWPEPVSNLDSFLGVFRGTFGDLEGGLPVVGVNYGVNGQPWFTGTSTPQKAIGLPPLGGLDIESSSYTIFVADKGNASHQDIALWFSSGGISGVEPINYSFLNFEYDATPTPEALINSINFIKHGGLTINDGDTTLGEEFSGTSNFWWFDFDWPNSVKNIQALFVVFRGTFGDVEGEELIRGDNYDATVQAFPAGNFTVVKQLSWSFVIDEDTTPSKYTAAIMERDPKFLDDYGVDEQIKWFASGGKEGIPPIKYSFLEFDHIASSTPTPECCSNIAFFPGLQASRLYQGGNQLWPPTLTTNNDDLRPLFLNPDGTSINSDIIVGDIIDEDDVIGENVYKGFMNFMDSEMAGENVINEWEAMPYDWRLPLSEILTSGKKVGGTDESPRLSYLEATTSPYIIQEVRRLADTSKNGKVTIIAHSNGGLLAKVFLQSLEDTNDPLLDKIDKLILVATPQVGTPAAVEGLLHGDRSQIGLFEFGFLLDEEIAREFGENMQSVYNLIPSQEYFNKVLTPVIAFADNISSLFELSSYAGSTITNQDSLSNFLLGDGVRSEPDSNDEESPNVLKQAILMKAVDLHDSVLDTWTPPEGLEVIQIAGWGEDTISTIEYSCGFFTCLSLSTLDRDIQFTSEGDGTVVFPSAVFLDGNEYFVNLKEFNSPSRKNRDHKNILEIDSLQELIKLSIQGDIDDNNLPSFISTTKPIENSTRKRIVLRSPVLIGVFDSSGRYTGLIDNPNSDILIVKEDIPNSYYREIAGHKYLGFDNTDVYTIELQGLDLGTFTLEINDIFNDQIVEINSFIDIPVTASTTGSLSISATTTSILVLDIDGDGVNDISLKSGEYLNATTSLEILLKVIKTLDIRKDFKKELNKKIKKTQKELTKDKLNKAVKKLNHIIKKLEKEIQKNLKHIDKKRKKEDHKHKKQKISTENAEKLVDIIETIRDGVL